MSFQRKNARRLRDLRRHGVPINGDYVLTEEWGVRKQGEYIDEKTQKEWLAQLRPPRPIVVAQRGFPLRGGRAA